MRFTPDLEPGETLQYQEVFPTYERAGEPFSFAIGLSDRAVHVLGQKGFAIRSPWYERRIPASQVQEVAIEKVDVRGLWWLAALLVAVGIAGTWLLEAYARDYGGLEELLLFPAVAGLMLPFTTRGRRRLVLRLHGDETITAAPPLFLLGERRRRVWDAMERILDAFRVSGIPTRNEME